MRLPANNLVVSLAYKGKNSKGMEWDGPIGQMPYGEIYHIVSEKIAGK